jgi:hypothetical protein
MYTCFFHILTNGLRSAGGIGDALQTPSFVHEEDKYFWKLLLDVTFFGVVIIVLLNGGAFAVPAHAWRLSVGADVAPTHAARALVLCCNAHRAVTAAVVFGLITDSFVEQRDVRAKVAQLCSPDAVSGNVRSARACARVCARVGWKALPCCSCAVLCPTPVRRPLSVTLVPCCAPLRRFGRTSRSCCGWRRCEKTN